MMKKMNKKLLGSLILGLMLSAPVSQVCAADLKGGAIYGTGDSYSSDPNIVTDDGTTLTYNFNGDSQLTITDDTTGNPGSYGIYIQGGQNPDVKNITVADKLDISITKNNNYNILSGIAIAPDYNDVSGRSIERNAGGNIDINSNNGGASLEGVSIMVGSNNTVSIGESNITLIADNVQDSYMMLYGLHIGGSDNQIKMSGGIIDITGSTLANSENYTYGIGMWAHGAGNSINTENVTVNVNTTSNENTVFSLNYGINAESGTTISTGNGDITIHGTGGQAVYSYGIYALGGNVNVGIVDITAQTSGGDSTAKAIGIYGLDSGIINYAGGTITAVADDNERAYVAAVNADDGAKVNINEGTNNTVVIKGDIEAANGGTVSLKMNTADSAVTGGFDTYKGSGTINLNLADGALWNATKYSEVSTLSLDNGNVYINTKSSFATDINIGTYSGTGNVYFRVDDINKDGIAKINTGAFVIDKATENSFIHVGAVNNSVNTLDVGKTEEGLNALAKKVFYRGSDDGHLTGEVVLEEGLLTPEARGDLLFDPQSYSPGRGYVTNITGGDRTTETMYAMKNLAATAIVAWRQEDSTFSQRLGELRESTGGQGIWARMSRGEFEYDGEYKNQYNFFQLGYDWASDNWHYGVAVSHNDGETAYTYGSGENRSTSLSLYGTWLGDAGHYADIVLKQGRLSNDFDVYTSAGHTSGDYDAWGTSLSGEYGKKILLENDWYVTPQAQLTLMRIGGEDYDTNNGIHVRQDTLYSAVGRLGFELGRKLDEKGSVYAKASVLHDFAGNAETYLSYNGFTNSYSQDLSDTWFEAGIGFNYRTGDNSYIYADVVRTFGGDVETPWQWNIGMRWSC